MSADGSGNCARVGITQPSADDGVLLNAEYHIEPEGQFLSLVLESWSGGKAGSRLPRNPDYNRALIFSLVRS